MKVKKYKNKYWAVYDINGTLICICVYKKGTLNVVKSMQSLLQQKDVTSGV